MVTEDVTANAVKNAMALEKEGMMSCGGGWNLYSEKKKKRLGCILCAQNLFLWEEWCDVFYAAIARLRLSLYACGFLPYFCEWIERKLQDCILERNTEVDCMQCTWAWRVLNVRKPHAVFLVSLTLISVIQSNCTNDPFFPASLKSNNNLSVTVCHSGAKAKEIWGESFSLYHVDISPLPFILPSKLERDGMPFWSEGEGKIYGTVIIFLPCILPSIP